MGRSGNENRLLNPWMAAAHGSGSSTELVRSWRDSEGHIQVGFNSRQSARLEALRERQREAGLVSERYPQVEEITLETVFHDTDGRPVQRRIKHVTGESFALFELRCPIEGALISLNDVVREVIEKHGRRRSGAIECRGDGEENGIVMPAHSMDYVVRIRYHRARKASPKKTARSKSAARTSTSTTSRTKGTGSSTKRKASAAKKTTGARRSATSTSAKATKRTAKRTTASTSRRSTKKTTASRKARKTVVKVQATKSRKKSVPATRRTTRRRAIA